MKFLYSKFIFLFAIIFVVFNSLPVFADEINVIGADEIWIMDVVAIANEALDSSDAAFKLSDEAVICHVDETWNYGFDALASGVTDATDASFTIPAEAQICHADEIWANRIG